MLEDEILAAGTGAANDATVITIDNVGVIEAAIAEARLRFDHDVLVRNVANAEAKVALMKEHVASAEQSVRDAKAELKAYEGNR